MTKNKNTGYFIQCYRTDFYYLIKKFAGLKSNWMKEKEPVFPKKSIYNHKQPWNSLIVINSPNADEVLGLAASRSEEIAIWNNMENTSEKKQS
jgi:hypothetical protein